MEYFVAGKTKKKTQEEIKEKLEIKRLHKNVIAEFKSWGGLCATVEELQQIIKKKCDNDVHIVKTELALLWSHS